MKKILITRRLLRSCEDKAKETFEANFNLNDELYSQKKLIELSGGQDGILSSLTEKLYAEIIDASQNKGSAIKKREDTHKMAESNKAFAHFRW